MLLFCNNLIEDLSMEVNLLVEGLKFMVLGMTTVFLFLILMIFVLKAQAKVIQKYFPPKPPSASKSSAPRAMSADTQDNSEVIAVITAAITDFKKR